MERDVWARIHKINGLSAHADREGLIQFARRTAERGHLRAVALVHGEERPRRALGDALLRAGIRRVVYGERGERLELA
jgi:metallo-beta-lactamase family protein